MSSRNEIRCSSASDAGAEAVLAVSQRALALFISFTTNFHHLLPQLFPFLPFLLAPTPRPFTTLVHIFTMEVDWDSKTVIGNKGKAPKVTKKDADLNGALFPLFRFQGFD